MVLDELDDVKEMLEQAGRHYEKGNYSQARKLVRQAKSELEHIDSSILGTKAATKILTGEENKITERRI